MIDSGACKCLIICFAMYLLASSVNAFFCLDAWGNSLFDDIGVWFQYIVVVVIVVVAAAAAAAAI